MPLSDFDFELPDELIAREPLPARSASRLLHVRHPSAVTADGPDDGAPSRAGNPGRSGGGPLLADLRFTDLPALLSPGDLLVVNDSRVMPARLFGRKATGGRVEILVERVELPCEALAMVRASKSPPPGSLLVLDGMTGDEGRVEVLGRAHETFFRLRFARPVAEIMAAVGHLPLPPYIDRPADDRDDERYQTVYARSAGSVAAPTAGLHFDEEILEALAQRGVRRVRVTLHVGAGTFAPVREQDIDRHRMHEEIYDVPPETVEAIAATRAAGGRVVAVGTTSLRSLESAARALLGATAGGTTVSEAERQAGVRAGPGATRLFMRPGDGFAVVDRLITNFHLPRSTLIMLVAAFAGLPTIRAAYAHAVADRYRFFSYGDAMFLDMSPPPLERAPRNA